MQRRKAEASGQGGGTNSTLGHQLLSNDQQQQSQDPRSLARPRSNVKRTNSTTMTSIVTIRNLLVVILVLLVVLSVLSPATVEKAESDAAESAKEIWKEAYVAEQQMEEFFHPQQQRPPLHWVESEVDAAAGKQLSEEASEAMRRQPSSWVDGEKKLKAKLKELVELQKEGKFLEVPILTRWLGDDFPAWVPEGQDKEEWERQRQERYAAMAKEEQAWRASVRRQFLDSHEV